MYYCVFNLSFIIESTLLFMCVFDSDAAHTLIHFGGEENKQLRWMDLFLHFSIVCQSGGLRPILFKYHKHG